MDVDISMKSKRSIAAKKRWEKYHCYRQAFLNMGCTPMSKEQKKKMPVELVLTRKDAENLSYLMCEPLVNARNIEMQPTRQIILNKLKRQGIK